MEEHIPVYPAFNFCTETVLIGLKNKCNVCVSVLEWICKSNIPISSKQWEGENGVVNLSKEFHPSTPQLNRGRNLIPTKGYNKNLWFQCKYDIQQYHRRVKLAIYYWNKNDSELQPFTLKSDWSRHIGQHPHLVRAVLGLFPKLFSNKLHQT